MRRLLLALLLCLSALGGDQARAQAVNLNCFTGATPFWGPCYTGNPLNTRSGQYGTGTTKPQYCQITSLSSATNLTTANCSTGSILTGATIAEICVSTQGVRYTSTGVVTPTASIGIPVPSGTCFQYSGPLATVQFIQQSSGAILDIETFP